MGKKLAVYSRVIGKWCLEMLRKPLEVVSKFLEFGVGHSAGSQRENRRGVGSVLKAAVTAWSEESCSSTPGKLRSGAKMSLTLGDDVDGVEPPPLRRRSRRSIDSCVVSVAQPPRAFDDFPWTRRAARKSNERSQPASQPAEPSRAEIEPSLRRFNISIVPRPDHRRPPRKRAEPRISTHYVHT